MIMIMNHDSIHVDPNHVDELNSDRKFPAFGWNTGGACKHGSEGPLSLWSSSASF